MEKWIKLVLLISCYLMLAVACSGGGGESSVEQNEVSKVSMQLEVDMSELSKARSKIQGSQADVKKVIGELASEEGFEMVNILFEKGESSIWKSDLIELPENQMLSLKVFAYDEADLMLYKGELDFEAKENLSLIVPVKGVNSDEVNNPPIINSVLVPSEIGHEMTASFVVHSTDEDLDDLSYLWSVDSGTIEGLATDNVLVWTSASNINNVVLKLSVFDGLDQTDYQIELNVGYTGESEVTLVFLPVALGFDAVWTGGNLLDISARVDYDENQIMEYKWLDDDAKILSVEDYVILNMTDEIRANGLNLELGYSGISIKSSYKYNLENQIAPVIIYQD